jgi:ParB family chromosome partitioning protein
MPPRRGGLGRGLDALIAPAAPAGAAGERQAEEDGAAGPAQRAPLEVEIGRIQPNPLQPRKQVDPVLLQELAGSIREHGVIQPLVVTEAETRPGDDPARPRYVLVAGERRWQAAKLAGLVRVPVVVREAAGRELLELALVENVQRADLNALEEAAAYQQLAETFGMTQEEIGQRVGKSRFAVTNTLRLLQLPAAVQQALLDGQITEGHARAILGLAGDRDAQRQMAHDVARRGLNVRQTEELVRRAQARAQAGPERPRSRAPADEVEERFRELLATRVTLSRGRRGGRLVIHFYDDEQLQSIYDRLSGER